MEMNFASWALRLAKSISDAGWSQFTMILTSKADEWDEDFARMTAGDNYIATGGSAEICDKIHAVMTFDR
jgi:hypothetical protein